MFIMVGIFAGVAGGIYITVFNNFLNSTYQLTETQRGFLGERFVLCSEAILLIIICCGCGYAFAQKIFSASVAVIIMCACYIIDNSLNVVEMARSTYVKKICETPDDVTPTLSTGTSLDHIFSMTIPALGGLLWKFTGTYQSVFIAAAIVAIINLGLSLNIRLPKQKGTNIN